LNDYAFLVIIAIMDWDRRSFKKLRWAGRSREDLAEMDKAVRAFFGGKLEALQAGERLAPPAAKTLTGYDPQAVEIIKDYNKDTYRAVVTLQLQDAIYVLHAFKKKSTHGIGLTKHDEELIAQRLRWAVEDHENRREQRRKKQGGRDGV
jgi:phage-related protein